MSKPRRKTKATNVRHAVLSVGVALSDVNGSLPTQFRLFVAGWNDTTKGRFLFDAEAAASVLAAYAEHGVDLMIDLEHQALDGYTPPEATARDARGWFQLAVQNGELWAVNVRWTPDGAARLSEKRQRYISPAFAVDPETSRVTRVINAAICAMPATHETPALVAASTNGARMDPKLVAESLDALLAGDAEKCMELLKGMLASAAGADPDAATEDAPPPVGDGGADEAMEASAPPIPPTEDKKEEVAAAMSQILRLSNTASFVTAAAEVEVWKASHIALEGERQKLAHERAMLEAAERRKLCVELVTLGAEFPATVWADDKASALKPRWLKMELVELRAHVAEQSKARGGKPAARPVTASTGASPVAANGKEYRTPLGPIVITAQEIENCVQAKADPQVYANNKMIHMKAKG